MKNNERNQQEQMINEAKAYFDACGMSESFEKLFAKETVKTLIHEKYSAYEAEVQVMSQEVSELEMPDPIIERVKQVAEAATGKEESYFEDVKISVLLSLHNLFQAIELVVTVDDSIKGAFKKAFESDEENSKIMGILTEISDGVIGKMMDKLIKKMCVPAGMPESIVDIMMMIGGGMPMMNLSEMESMFGGGDDSDDDYDDDDCDDDDVPKPEDHCEAEEGNSCC